MHKQVVFYKGYLFLASKSTPAVNWLHPTVNSSQGWTFLYSYSHKPEAHKTHQRPRLLERVDFCRGSVVGEGRSGTSVGGLVFLWPGWSWHLSAWIHHPYRAKGHAHANNTDREVWTWCSFLFVCLCVRMRRLQESLPQPSLSTQATCLLFPVFLRKVDSTCGGPEGGREAGERMCVCLIVSQLLY